MQLTSLTELDKNKLKYNADKSSICYVLFSYPRYIKFHRCREKNSLLLLSCERSDWHLSLLSLPQHLDGRIDMRRRAACPRPEIHVE